MAAKLEFIDLAKSLGSNPVRNGAGPTSGPTVAIGKNKVSLFTIELLRELARVAGLSRINVSSVKRTPAVQAGILFRKHVLGGDAPNYANKNVALWVREAAQEQEDGWNSSDIIREMTQKILATHGGPASVSRHCVNDPTLEVVDVAHWGRDKNKQRVNFMSDTEAQAFLAACLQKLPLPILKIGHSKELGITDKKHEFVDERCFHLEIRTSPAASSDTTAPATISI
jgi:hypothetical protein